MRAKRKRERVEVEASMSGGLVRIKVIGAPLSEVILSREPRWPWFEAELPEAAARLLGEVLAEVLNGEVSRVGSAGP